MRMRGISPLWRSLTFRLALLYVALFVGSVGLLLGIFYWLAVARPMEQAAKTVDAEITSLAAADLHDGRAALLRLLARRLRTSSEMKPFHALITSDGQVVSANLPSWPTASFVGWRRMEADFHKEGDEHDQEALVIETRLRDGARLLIGRNIEILDDREELLAGSAIWIVCVAALLAILGSVAMSAAVTRRIDVVSNAARRVMGGDLSERIPLRGTGDDFDDLAETLNLMLGRIEELIESIRRVSDSVAHELRTPLARLHADLDELSTSNSDEKQRACLIGQAVAEARRLQSVFDALLRIARIEAGLHATGIRTVDLTTLLRDAAEFYAPEAEARNQRLRSHIAEDLRLDADPDLLFQAVSNLLDNAIKYAPVGGHVELAARQNADADMVEIVISDDGSGIAPGDRPRVTERFYRAAGTGGTPGMGLGLSLVAAVALLHRAKLVIHDSPHGRISLVLPVKRSS